MRNSFKRVVLASALCLIASVSCADEPAYAEIANDNVKVYRYYNLKLSVWSWHPDNPLKSFRQHTTGNTSNGAEVGLGGGNFTVKVRSVPDAEGISAKVKMTPDAKNKNVKPLDVEIKLPDLEERTLELAKDDDGRIYRLTIRPEIVEAKLPRKFDVDELELTGFDFNYSPVILNDRTYLGQIGMSGGTLSGVEIAGVANIEFSLLPLKDAEPLGTLSNGKLEIVKGKTTIMISGVRNGAKPQILDDGPYQVWVRWLEPSMPQAETQELIREQLKVFKQLRADGNLAVTPEIIQRLEEYAESGSPMVLGSHARDVRQEELQ